MLGKRIMTIMALALLFSKAATAISYRTPELRRLAHVAGVREESLSPGLNYLNGCTVRVDDDMTVRHVGLTLFMEEMKQMGNQLILEFVERYFLQLTHPAPNSSTSLMLLSDGISFPKGRWQDIKGIKPGIPFRIDYQLMRYTLTWNREGNSLSISFPGKYQLICGEDLTQAEDHLPQDILRTAPVKHAPVSVNEMQSSSRNGFYIRKGAWLYTESLNATTYYSRNTDGSLSPVVNADLLEESVADIMMCPDAAEPFTLDITMHRYGYKTSKMSVPVIKWIDYCSNMGCDIYCGIESVSNGVVKATILAVNQRLNFNHLLNVYVPSAVVDKGEGVIQAELDAFIPTHNILNINGKYIKKETIKID